MNPLSLLCEIVAQGGPISAGFYRGATFDALVRHGFLQEAGIAGSVVCKNCDEIHSAAVVFESGKYGYYCAECGFVALDPAEITTFRPDVSVLINRLAEVFTCKRRKSSSLSGETWRIGAATTASEPVMIYFQPKLQTEDDAFELQSALGREARNEWSLVVTAKGSLPVEGFAMARLDDLVQLNLETGALRSIADLGVLVGIPRKNRGGRPNEHGALIKPLVERRILEGEALETIGAEARAVRSILEAEHPDKTAPADSTIKRYIRKARGGS